MVSKEQFVNLIDRAWEAYDAHYLALEALGLEVTEDKMVHFVDAALDFAAEAMGDNGLPENLDEDGAFYHCGHDMPIVCWWAWEAQWGTLMSELTIGDRVFDISDAAGLYDAIAAVRDITG